MPMEMTYKPLLPEQAEENAKSIAFALRKAARKARAPASILAGGGANKVRRGDRLFNRGVIISFILMVLIPFLASSIYLPFIASDQHASEARFAVRNRKSSPMDSILGMAGISGSQQTQDSQIIVNYLKSRAAIDEIDKRFDLKKIYSDRSYDYIFRFSRDESREEFEKYWKRQVNVVLDKTTGIITVEVRAFQPEDALAVNRALLELAEHMVNELSNRAKFDSLRQSEQDLKRNEARLEQAILNLRDVRNREGVLDVGAQAEATMGVVSQLRLALAKIEQELLSRQGQLSADAPQVRFLQAQSNALRTKIQDFERQLASEGASGKSLSGSAVELDRQRLDVQIAQEQYATALALYERARTETETQGAYLLTFLPPTLSEEAQYPKRWLIWSVIVFPLFLLWSILVGVATLIRNHMAA
ncbi:MAG: hypothetical protein CFE31_19360 [Rhizobiales bacterium PAR1]|nr:MAG: hypothetical protein CFE31_19360 [Rhizobiales bacterium PAR1]